MDPCCMNRCREETSQATPLILDWQSSPQRDDISVAITMVNSFIIGFIIYQATCLINSYYFIALYLSAWLSVFLIPFLAFHWTRVRYGKCSFLLSEVYKIMILLLIATCILYSSLYSGNLALSCLTFIASLICILRFHYHYIIRPIGYDSESGPYFRLMHAIENSIHGDLESA
ncbi:hypothetical protein BDQ12DRAFT_689026 [Crucibulum laeve]|uniref:Uncharacterized protein n=1 Tax=Crucibulum laeve TaxID=68775 RepID=A0A5C3LPC0_9AGAR|nr:hypothetical protein BDQ12DRAFT_689026 [Crucibulum laeve]